MVDVAAQESRIETRDDLGEGDAALFAYWEAQEAIAEREERKWVKQGRDIVKRYRDERPEAAQGTHKFNILWSNVQTLVPILYGRTPKPDVERRFRDEDPVARLAATLMERALSYSIDAFDFDSMLEGAVEDRLLPGRGVARVLYIPHFGEELEQEATEEFENAEEQGSVVDNSGDANAEKLREVVFEEVVGQYVFWEDYREGPARQWAEVPWVRFRSYLTRDQLTDRFGKKKAGQVTLDYTPKGMSESSKDNPPPDLYKKAVVHEVWDKVKRQVVWYAPSTADLILDELDDPLRLPDFFPNPDPLRSTTTNDKRVPVADYIEYQDQARELDTLTARIDKLVTALKVSGVYAGDDKSVLQQLVDEGTENKLIPVGDSQNWSDKGGLKGIIEWMPIQQIAETLIQLYSARDKVKTVLYELTGIGDILRGMTSPDETLGAQELKANFSTRRITPQQKKVAKFARNFLRLMAAVIAEHFSAKTISMMTGYPQLDPVPPMPPRPTPPMQMAPPQPAQVGPDGQPVPQQPDPQMQAFQQAMAQWQQAANAIQAVMQKNTAKQQQFEAAVKLIKDDGVHGFRIDIEADSTIAPDEQAERQSRVQFMQQFVPFMEQVVPIAQGNAAMAELAKEMTLFVVRGFRVARPLEETIGKAFDTLARMPPPQPKGAQQNAGPDAPEALALRNKETDARVQIAREKNAVDMAKLGVQTDLETNKLAEQHAANRGKAVIDIAKQLDQQRFRDVRASSIEAREASQLT